jgi:hypothetical protein
MDRTVYFDEVSYLPSCENCVDVRPVPSSNVTLTGQQGQNTGR